MLGNELKAATLASSAVRGEAVIEHRDDLSPEATAERLLKLGRDVDAIAVVTVDHPRITEAIERLRADRVPVVAVISDLTAPARAGYVGLDNWKVGATAGWAMAKLCKRPGKIAVFVGNHRYLCQDMCEIRFRSYFRERATDFQVLDAITTFEDSKYAYQSTLDLLHHTPDLVGLFIAGGGKSGVLRGLREDASWVGEDRQRGRPGFDPRGAVRTPRRCRRRHSLAPDQVARRNYSGITRQRDGRGDER